MSLALPVEIHKQNGTYRPTRQRDREEGVLELDDKYPELPDHLADFPAAVEVWNEIKEIMEPSKIYNAADANKLTRYCLLEAEFRKKVNNFPINRMQTMRTLERDLYLCPSSRAKIGVKPKKEANAFEKFKK